MIYLQIFETFKSQKELEKLTTNIIRIIATNTIEMFEKQPDKIYNIIGAMNVFKYTDNDYDEIKSFIDNYILDIECVNDIRGLSSVNGTFKPINNNRGIITLRISNGFIERIKESDYIITKKVESLSSMMYYEIYEHLLHELQHVYDYYRSKGNYLNTKEFNTFSDRRSDTEEIIRKKQNNLSISDEEIKKANNNIIQYLNLRHEIDARFTTTIQQMRFFDINYISENDKMIRSYNIKPFIDIKEDFVLYFHGFKKLSDINKRRVLHLLGKFYIKMQDEVKRLNKENK